MKLNSVIVVIISLIVQRTVSFCCFVTMNIKLEEDSNTILLVNFYNDTFYRLFNCMADVATTQCDVNTEFQGYESNSTTNLKVTDVKSINGTQTYPGYFFTCLYEQPTGIIRCSKNTTNQCTGDMNTSFRFCKNATDEHVDLQTGLHDVSLIIGLICGLMLSFILVAIGFCRYSRIRSSVDASAANLTVAYSGTRGSDVNNTYINSNLSDIYSPCYEDYRTGQDLGGDCGYCQIDLHYGMAVCETELN